MKLRQELRIIVATLGALSFVLLVVMHDEGVEWAYGRDDWEHAVAPSWGWDSDGDLRQHDSFNFYGSAWSEREGTLNELLEAWGDVADLMVLEQAA